MKLPREMLTRFEEFSKTTILNSRQINELYQQYKDRPVILTIPTPVPLEACHSLTGCVVKTGDVDRWDAYMRLARKLVPSPLRTTGAEVAKDEDMAVLLLILEACTRSMNSDGSMPTARIRENWEILHANDMVKRPWVPKRYTALRDHLSQMGHLDWEDPHYVPGPLSETGKGQAAKWCASESLLERIEEEKQVLDQGDFERETERDRETQEREEDLYSDKSDTSPSHDSEPDWILQLQIANYIRPVLNPDVWRMKMAC
jgi:hypothetical protein